MRHFYKCNKCTKFVKKPKTTHYHKMMFERTPCCDGGYVIHRVGCEHHVNNFVYDPNNLKDPKTGEYL